MTQRRRKTLTGVMMVIKMLSNDVAVIEVTNEEGLNKLREDSRGKIGTAR